MINFNKIPNVLLITGGIWHFDALEVLKKQKKNIYIIDDNENFYLKKFIKPQQYLGNTKNIKKIFKKYKKNVVAWSPVSDYGSILADKFNYKYFNNFFRSRINTKKINKKVIKKYLKKEELKIPRNLNYNEYGISKPLNGSGSKNISFTNKNKKNYFKEEIISGTELSIESITRNNKNKILAVSLRLLANKKSAEAIIKLNVNLKRAKKLTVFIDKILKALKVKSGITHIEAILNKKEELIPIDCNIRCGGSGVASKLLLFKDYENAIYKDFKSIFLKKKNISVKLKYNFSALLFFSSFNNKLVKRKNKNINILKNNNNFKNSDLNRNGYILVKNQNQKRFYNDIRYFFKNKNDFEIIKNLIFKTEKLLS